MVPKCNRYLLFQIFFPVILSYIYFFLFTHILFLDKNSIIKTNCSQMLTSADEVVLLVLGPNELSIKASLEDSD